MDPMAMKINGMNEIIINLINITTNKKEKNKRRKKSVNHLFFIKLYI